MLPRGHVIASGIVGLCVWAYFKSIGCAAVSFASGVLLDADHLIDYYASHGFTFKFKDIYAVCRDVKLKRLFLVLHSYELLTLFWIAIFAFGLSNIWKALAIGWTQHILLDQFTNPINPPGYFITYRLIQGFKKERIIH